MGAADFWRFYSAVVQRKWVVLATVLGSMTVITIGCLLLPRYYRATALVIPSEEALQRPMICRQRRQCDRGRSASAPAGSPEREERLGNLVFLATSQAVVGRALAPLHMQAHPGAGAEGDHGGAAAPHLDPSHHHPGEATRRAPSRWRTPWRTPSLTSTRNSATGRPSTTGASWKSSSPRPE